MRLLKTVQFKDQSGKVWTAESGSVINGLSVPRFFWRFQPPFSGAARRASIIHDVECEKKRNRWQDVHNVFYEMLRADGVGFWKATLLYRAVWHFGPRW